MLARTGGNTITDAEDAVIETGDAYANANIVNVANTNVIDSEYLFVILNAFASISGDIVFPSLTSYLSTLAGGTSASSTIHNDAVVNNNLELNAETGNNTASTTGSNLIETGIAGTGASLFNQINTTLTGGNSVSIFFRIDGDWNGEVFGLPDNVSWIETNNGYMLHIEPNIAGGAQAQSQSVVHATNTARINNNILVSAETGENGVENAETALISTGNAYAGANIVNVANANVIGRNWLMAIVNIFGDLEGDIAFGRPDLWIGGMLNAPRSPENGDEVTYRYTIENRGDSPASNVVITDTYSQYTVPIASEAGAYQIDENARTLTWNVDEIAPGETVEVAYRAKIENVDTQSEVTNTIVARERETDNNDADNTEIITFFAGPHHGGGQRQKDRDKEEASEEPETQEVATASIESLEITRSPMNIVVTDRENTTTQTLTIHNPTDKPVPNVMLRDVLNNGKIKLSDEAWFLGTILPNEELTISYSLGFEEGTPNGKYRFSTRVISGGEERTLLDNGTLLYQAFFDTSSEAPTVAYAATHDSEGLPEGSVEGESISMKESDEPSQNFIKTAAAWSGVTAQANEASWPLIRVVVSLVLLTLLAYAGWYTYRLRLWR